ncbi:uncharacterized protein LOC123530309 [Mercenaria mercenaria]|uniref:uncharacterized protein LOC123530309 n=1 Tax=Mercenaria mercenaria TaxID=6596 RepID=UPI00234F4F55|nr:uncharacterized protein LOC123530309 [Mercenaria mercenaria]
MADKWSPSVKNTSDEIVDILCEPCEKDGKRIEAAGYCSDCSEYLCKHCYTYHRKLKVFQNHVLLDKDKMPQIPTSVSVKDVCQQKCGSHGDVTVDFFCGSCNSLGCSVCIALNHRQCQNVNHIPDIAKGTECIEQVREFSKNIDDICQQLNSSTNSADANIQDFSKMCIRAKAELKRQRTDVNRFFDSLEYMMETQINDKEIDINNELQDVLSHKIMAITDLQNIKSDLETKMKTGQKCELFIAMQKAKHILERKRGDLKKEPQKKNIEYIPSLQIEDMMKRINSMGSVVVKGSEKMSTAKVRTKVNLRTSKDKASPVISGLCVLSDHNAIVVDNGNKKVKVVDLKKLCVVSEKNMITRLWDVTKVADNQVAVTLPDEKKIQFLTLSKAGTLSKDHHINVQGECAGIACCRQNLIISCITYVQILDLKGTVKRNIFADVNGESLFKRALYLVLSPDLETIYVSDNVKNTVTRVTLDGKVKDVYRELTEPYGIVVDNEGCVFVASLECQTFISCLLTWQSGDTEYTGWVHSIFMQ